MKKWSKRYWIGLLGILVIVLGVGMTWYIKQPVFQVHRYMKAINQQDFERAYEFFYKDKVINDEKKQDVIGCIEKYFTQGQFIRLELDGIQVKSYVHEQTGNERKYFKVKYIFENNIVENGISLMKEEGEWKIIFPFKLTDVAVYAPVGATVYFDGQEMEKQNDGDYCIKNVLPGKHIVKMKFFDNIYGDYVEVMNVPEQKEVISPYETVQVSVDTPKNMIVELAGERKINVNGKIVFENVLEGTYTLKVTDPYGHLEQWIETVDVSKESKQFDVDTLAFSKQGKDKIATYIEGFYGMYRIGIKKQDASFINDYVATEQREKVKESFESWFIKNKNVKDSQMIFEIEGIEQIENGLFSVKVLEEIDLVNKEIDQEQRKIERNYKVVMKTSVLLEPVGESYIIADKIIDESIVSYKDESGKWIAY